MFRADGVELDARYTDCGVLMFDLNTQNVGCGGSGYGCCASVLGGHILGAVGVYQPLADWAGAGATVPLTGFGNLLAKGVKKAVAESGLLGAFTGGFTAAAGGICAAVFFGLIVALLFKPGDKNK